MSTRFSLIYPTRHRPAFIKYALRFLEKQHYDNFEVIISDNYVDPSLSCQNVCNNSVLPDLKYIHPPTPLGMVENWNYAYQFASGEYILYFTDKMFLLPDLLSRADVCVQNLRPDIISWVDNPYRPLKPPQYFDKGFYVKASASVPKNLEYVSFDPHRELSKKALAAVSRSEQDRSSYARGKICFGAFKNSLCHSIVTLTGRLFHNISPDYTCMILGLSLAQSAAELAGSGIVHMDTDLSTGGQANANDQIMIAFLRQLDNSHTVLTELLIPGLYSSQHNVVAHDYITLKNKYFLEFDFDRLNWLLHIAGDLNMPDRIWSSPEVEHEQKTLFHKFIHQQLTPLQKIKLRRGLISRNIQKLRHQAFRRCISILKPIVLRLFQNSISSFKPHPRYCSEVDDILNFHESS